MTVYVLMQNDFPIAVYKDMEEASRAAKEREGSKPTIQSGYFHVHGVPLIERV